MQTASSTPAVHLAEIGQIALAVIDIERAKKFYRDTLGIRFLFDAGTMVFFQAGTIRLMIGLAEKPVLPGGAVLYFKVDDIGATHTGLVEQGVCFLQPPHLVAKMADHDLWMAFLEDPDKNTLALMSEVPRS